MFWRVSIWITHTQFVEYYSKWQGRLLKTWHRILRVLVLKLKCNLTICTGMRRILCGEGKPYFSIISICSDCFFVAMYSSLHTDCESTVTSDWQWAREIHWGSGFLKLLSISTYFRTIIYVIFFSSRFCHLQLTVTFRRKTNIKALYSAGRREIWMHNDENCTTGKRDCRL